MNQFPSVDCSFLYQRLEYPLLMIAPHPSQLIVFTGQGLWRGVPAVSTEPQTLLIPCAVEVAQHYGAFPPHAHSLTALHSVIMSKL